MPALRSPLLSEKPCPNLYLSSVDDETNMENCSQTYNGHKKENKITPQQFAILVGFHIVGLKKSRWKETWGEKSLLHIIILHIIHVLTVHHQERPKQKFKQESEGRNCSRNHRVVPITSLVSMTHSACSPIYFAQIVLYPSSTLFFKKIILWYLRFMHALSSPFSFPTMW